MKNLTRAVHRGVLSIELVIILAIVVILIIYIFSNSGSLFSKNNTPVTQTRTLLKTKGVYDFTTAAQMTGMLAQFGGVPNSMTLLGNKSAGTATVINTWGGSVTVQPETSAGNNKTGFSVSYTGVPQEACVTLATKLSQTSVIAETTINTTPTIGPVSAALTGAQCVADTGPAGNNTLKFKSLT